jgi:hypothetical protein
MIEPQGSRNLLDLRLSDRCNRGQKFGAVFENAKNAYMNFCLDVSRDNPRRLLTVISHSESVQGAQAGINILDPGRPFSWLETQTPHRRAGSRPTGKSPALLIFLSSPARKNIPLRAHPKSNLLFSPSHPHHEGRIAIVTDVGMGCGGRDNVARVRDRRADRQDP